MVNGSKCMAKNCTNHYLSNSNYFKFPKDLKRRKIWIRKCGRYVKDECINKITLTNSVNWRICQKHFENKMFLRKNRLSNFAFPTLFEDQSSDALGFTTESSDSSVVESGTSNSLLKTVHLDSWSLAPSHITNNTPRQLELQKELELANKRIKELEKSSACLNYSLISNNSAESLLNYCRQFLPENLVMIVQFHLMSKNRKKNGCRYTKQMKEFASSLYNLSPRAYCFLQSKISLPNESTIKRFNNKK